MAYQFAGRYGPEALIDNEGNAQTSETVSVLTSAGAAAALYSDRTKATLTGSNQATTDALRGNLTFFVDPGDYDVVTASAAFRVTITVDPAEVDAKIGLHASSADQHGDRAYIDGELGTHEALTTTAHGGLVASTDARLTDARAPTAHAAAHSPAGSDDLSSTYATKAYAEALGSGWHTALGGSVAVASTGNLTLSGEQTIDGVLTSASRVLVRNQTAPAENGVYVTAAGAWSRSTDADAASATEVSAGLFVFVSGGTANESTGWVLTTTGAITLGTTPLSFQQVSAAGQIVAGTGLTKTGSTLDVVAGAGLTAATDSIGITAGGVTGTEIAAAIKDPAAGTPGLRTLSTTSTTAAAGDHTHDFVSASGGGKETISAHGAAGSTETIDLAAGNVHTVILDASCALTFTGSTAAKACSFTLILTQDATGGRVVTWPASVDWPGGAIPSYSTGANKVSIWTFVTVDNGVTWLGFLSGDDMR